MESDAKPIRPERLCREISNAAPKNAVFVVDTGHAGMWMGGMFDLTLQTNLHKECRAILGRPSCLSWCKMSLPNKPVICYGDAGFWYHIPKSSSRKWNINTIVIVNNNSGGN